MTDYQNELVMEHLDLVNWVIRTRISVPNRPLLTYDDFYAIGCEAICRAALKYQADSGEFAPFACRYIYNAIIDHCRAMNYRLQRSVDAGFEEGEVLFDLLAHTTVDFEAEVTDDSAMSDVDDFDFICHVAFDKKPLTRKERANNVKKRDFLSKYKVVSPNHLFYKGQIIYSKIRPLLRKAVIAPFDGLCSADMYPLNTAINRKYLLRYMLSDAFNLQVATAMSSRVKMPKINQDELSKILIPIPPMQEQERIVSRIEELFDKITLI